MFLFFNYKRVRSILKLEESKQKRKMHRASTERYQMHINNNLSKLKRFHGRN